MVDPEVLKAIIRCAPRPGGLAVTPPPRAENQRTPTHSDAHCPCAQVLLLCGPLDE